VKRISLISLIFIFLVTNSQAAEAPLTMHTMTPPHVASHAIGLNELIEEALERNPEILAAKARRDAMQAKVSQAWALKKPWVSYDVMIENLETRVGPQENRFGVSQEIPFPTKLPLRTKVAKLAAMRVGHEVFHTEQLIRSQLVNAYADLMATQQILIIFEEERKSLEQTADVLRAQYLATEAGSADAFKIEAELAKIAEQILKITDRRVAAEERLNILLNRRQNEKWPLLSIPSLPDLQFDLETLRELTLQYRHGLIIKKLMLKEQGTKHSLAKMEYLPDVEVGFNYVQIGDGTTLSSNDGQDAWMIPVKINLPLWEPQIRGKVREEGKLKDAAVQDLRQAENMAVSDIIQKHTQYTTARDRVAVYEKTWVPQSEQALNSSLSGYRATGGKISILDVLDSLRMVLEAKTGYWQSYADTVSAYAAMEQAVGIPFDELGADEQDEHFRVLHPGKGDHDDQSKEK